MFDRYDISSSDDMRAALAALGTDTEKAAAKRAVVQVAGLNSDNLTESIEAAANKTLMRPARFELATS